MRYPPYAVVCCRPSAAVVFLPVVQLLVGNVTAVLETVSTTSPIQTIIGKLRAVNTDPGLRTQLSCADSAAYKFYVLLDPPLYVREMEVTDGSSLVANSVDLLRSRTKKYVQPSNSIARVARANAMTLPLDESRVLFYVEPPTRARSC